MHARKFLSYFLALCMVISLVPASVYSAFENTTDDYHTGCIPEPYDSSKHVASSYKIASTLPHSVDLTSNFPTPGNQKSQNSCTAWAVSYAKAAQEKKDHNWNVNWYNHKFSPAFIYNQINNGVDNGSSIDSALIWCFLKASAVSRTCHIMIMTIRRNQIKVKKNMRIIMESSIMRKHSMEMSKK